jgi:hypothetical protein
MSENYPGIIWELSSENYEWELSSENYAWELSSENYDLVYHHADKLRFIGILAYPKMYYNSVIIKFSVDLSRNKIIRIRNL